jgi:hypothetical protein
VNLRVVEREDLPLLTEWLNHPEFAGEFMWWPQKSRTEQEEEYDNLPLDTKQFFIEKKDDTKIGRIGHFMFGNLLEIYYYLARAVLLNVFGAVPLLFPFTTALTFTSCTFLQKKTSSGVKATCPCLPAHRQRP